MVTLKTIMEIKNAERMIGRRTVTMTTTVLVHSNFLCVILLPGWFPVIWLISLPFRSPVEIYMTVPVGAAGVRGLGGRGYLAYAAGVGAMGRGSGAGGAIYGLKGDKQAEEKLYDLLPGMELTPMNPAAMSLKAAAIKPAPQVTEHTWEPDSSQFTGWWALVFCFSTIFISFTI